MGRQTPYNRAQSLKYTYNSIAGDYYVKARLFKLWHTKRYREALNLTKTVKANSNVLDVGCDGGNFTRSLMKYGNVVGLDLSHSFISYAHNAHSDLPFLVGDGQRLPFRDESFDLVTCLEVLEHVLNPNSLASEVHRVLTPRGDFYRDRSR